ATLPEGVERFGADTLHQRLAQTRNGDELDRLAGVFNSMIARLDDSFHRIREFTLHASHELRTPLTVIRAGMESRLRDAPELSPVDREFLASQIEEIDRLTQITEGLTLLARADAGQMPLKVEPTRLDELVRESFADAQILAQSKG